MQKNDTSHAYGPTTIHAPQKLYLDTNHLINLAQLRRNKLRGDIQSYREIDRRIREQRCGLVFSEFSPLEWVEGAATPESAREIAAIFASASLVYQIKGDSMIWTSEVLRELHRIEPSVPALELPVIWVRRLGDMVSRALGIIATHGPDFVERESFIDGPPLSPTVPTLVPNESFENVAASALEFRKRRPRAYRERTDGFAAALQEDLKAFRPSASLPAHFPA
ncbi:MAG: hypothetical protein HZB38_00880 [Planctomycetes bacterium]|nr:hypothetical protein [Planctomycetota bacterium]